jgi:hypothetical protein
VHAPTPISRFRFVTTTLLCLGVAGCDPTYCAEVYGTIYSASGQSAPEQTKVTFYLGDPADTLRAQVLDSVYTRAGGAYEVRLQLFLLELSSVGIRSLGADTVAAIRSSTRCNRPPRTRVDLTAR